jgi:hypothetical protein
MLNCVKCLSEVQLDDQNFLLRLLTLMDVLKGPG